MVTKKYTNVQMWKYLAIVSIWTATSWTRAWLYPCTEAFRYRFAIYSFSINIICKLPKVFCFTWEEGHVNIMKHQVAALLVSEWSFRDVAPLNSFTGSTVQLVTKASEFSSRTRTWPRNRQWASNKREYNDNNYGTASHARWNNCVQVHGVRIKRASQK